MYALGLRCCGVRLQAGRQGRCVREHGSHITAQHPCLLHSRCGVLTFFAGSTCRVADVLASSSLITSPTFSHCRGGGGGGTHTAAHSTCHSSTHTRPCCPQWPSLLLASQPVVWWLATRCWGMMVGSNTHPPSTSPDPQAHAHTPPSLNHCHAQQAATVCMAAPTAAPPATCWHSMRMPSPSPPPPAQTCTPRPCPQVPSVTKPPPPASGAAQHPARTHTHAPEP